MEEIITAFTGQGSKSGDKYPFECPSPESEPPLTQNAISTNTLPSPPEPNHSGTEERLVKPESSPQTPLESLQPLQARGTDVALGIKAEKLSQSPPDQPHTPKSEVMDTSTSQLWTKPHPFLGDGISMSARPQVGQAIQRITTPQQMAAYHSNGTAAHLGKFFLPPQGRSGPSQRSSNVQMAIAGTNMHISPGPNAALFRLAYDAVLPVDLPVMLNRFVSSPSYMQSTMVTPQGLNTPQMAGYTPGGAFPQQQGQSGHSQKTMPFNQSQSVHFSPNGTLNRDNHVPTQPEQHHNSFPYMGNPRVPTNNQSGQLPQNAEEQLQDIFQSSSQNQYFEGDNRQHYVPKPPQKRERDDADRWGRVFAFSGSPDAKRQKPSQ